SKRAGVAGARRPPAAADREVCERLEGHAEPLDERSRRPAVFLGVPETARREHGKERRAGRRGAAEMDDVRGGHVDEVIAARAQPPAEVDVLAVHEEAVVEAAKL